MLDIQIVIWVFNPGTQVNSKFDADSNDAAGNNSPNQATNLRPLFMGWFGVPTIIEPLVKHFCQGYAGSIESHVVRRCPGSRIWNQKYQWNSREWLWSVISNWNSIFSINLKAKEWFEVYCFIGCKKFWSLEVTNDIWPAGTRCQGNCLGMAIVWSGFTLKLFGYGKAKTVRPS